MRTFRNLIGRPSHEDFSRIVYDALRHAGAGEGIVYHSEDFKFTLPNEITLYLANVYAGR